MSDDIVAELDAELALIEQLPYRVPIHALARRARDEIVALRERRVDIRRVVLEEAALYFDFEKLGVAPWKPEDIAAAIRALKEKP